MKFVKTAEAEPRFDLAELGLFDFNRLKEAAEGLEDQMIEGLIKTQSLNVLVGDSGIGKTALAAQLGVCIASGRDFLGFRVSRQGRVLYWDAETSREL